LGDIHEDYVAVTALWDNSIPLSATLSTDPDKSIKKRILQKHFWPNEVRRQEQDGVLRPKSFDASLVTISNAPAIGNIVTV
jgi:hypothetical protein